LCANAAPAASGVPPPPGWRWLRRTRTAACSRPRRSTSSFALTCWQDTSAAPAPRAPASRTCTGARPRLCPCGSLVSVPLLDEQAQASLAQAAVSRLAARLKVSCLVPCAQPALRHVEQGHPAGRPAPARLHRHAGAAAPAHRAEGLRAHQVGRPRPWHSAVRWAAGFQCDGCFTANWLPCLATT